MKNSHIYSTSKPFYYLIFGCLFFISIIVPLSMTAAAEPTANQLVSFTEKKTGTFQGVKLTLKQQIQEAETSGQIEERK